MADIYERMAVTKMTSSSTYSTGESPSRVWIARFEYANGLVTEYDGRSWKVVTPERG